MSTKPLAETSFTLTRRFEGADFDDVVARSRTALAEQGFGVLTEIDLQATLKKKLDVDRSRYLILGACNPALAHKATSNEPALGALLPCNVVVADESDAVVVAAIDPVAMFSVVDSEEVAPIAAEVKDKLQAAIDAI